VASDDARASGCCAWHQPRDMAIPKDKILSTETVTPDSQVGKSVLESRAAVQPR